MKNLPESSDPSRIPTTTCTISVQHGFYYSPEFIAGLKKETVKLLVMHERGHLSFVAGRMKPDVYRRTVETLDQLEREAMTPDLEKLGSDLAVNTFKPGRS